MRPKRRPRQQTKPDGLSPRAPKPEPTPEKIKTVGEEKMKE